MKVAVLGCGPAGLMVAHAVELAGHEPVILSRKQKSVIPGSVYLHRRVPGITGVYPDNHVQYIRMGTAQGYAEKVYGDSARTTGWENYMQVYPSWNAVKLYDALWNDYESQIREVDLDAETLVLLAGNYPVIFTTIPMPQVCCRPEDHEFNGAPYWIETLPVPPADEGRDVVVYNGLLTDSWYRWSVLSGICSIESCVEDYLEGDQVIQGIKPTTTTCDCHPLIERAGRWAEWRHGILLNDAFDKALEKMSAINYQRGRDLAGR